MGPHSSPTFDPLSRRSFLAIAAGLGASGALSACAVDTSKNSGGGDGGGGGAVRFSWWGNAERQKLIGEYAKTFSSKVSGASVQLEPSEYSGYTDKLSVQAAGQNLPDVFWMPANQVNTFASRGVLYDTAKLPQGTIDFSAFPTEQLDSWKVLGGKQSAPVYTQYSPATQIDKTAFSSAGISDFPDDEKWTWDDLGRLATDYAKKKGDGNWGIANMASFYQHAHLWIRQHGAEAFTADGKIGFDADVVGSWFAWWDKWQKAGGVMPRKVSGGKEQWPQTGGKTALYLVQLNQFIDNAAFSKGHDLQLVKSPVLPGAGADYQFKYYTRLCIAGNSKNAELAGKFVNFLLNDESAAKAVGLASGIPSNQKIADAVGRLGDPTNAKVLAIQGRIDKQPSRPRPEPPVGGSQWQKLIETAADDIFNGGVAIPEAVKKGIRALQTALDQG